MYSLFRCHCTKLLFLDNKIYFLRNIARHAQQQVINAHYALLSILLYINNLKMKHNAIKIAMTKMDQHIIMR